MVDQRVSVHVDQLHQSVANDLRQLEVCFNSLLPHVAQRLDLVETMIHIAQIRHYEVPDEHHVDFAVLVCLGDLKFSVVPQIQPEQKLISLLAL